jgi:hypothetical protein
MKVALYGFIKRKKVAAFLNVPFSNLILSGLAILTF